MGDCIKGKKYPLGHPCYTPYYKGRPIHPFELDGIRRAIIANIHIQQLEYGDDYPFDPREFCGVLQPEREDYTPEYISGEGRVVLRHLAEMRDMAILDYEITEEGRYIFDFSDLAEQFDLNKIEGYCWYVPIFNEDGELKDMDYVYLELEEREKATVRDKFERIIEGVRVLRGFRWIATILDIWGSVLSFWASPTGVIREHSRLTLSHLSAVSRASYFLCALFMAVHVSAETQKFNRQGEKDVD